MMPDVLPPYCLKCRTRMLPGSSIMVVINNSGPFGVRISQAIHLTCVTDEDEIMVPEPWEMEGL